MTTAKSTIKPETENRRLKKAIKDYCIACSGDSKTEAEKCPMKECPLWQYRK